MITKREATEKPSMKGGVMKRGATWSYVVREPDLKTGKSRPRWVGGFPTRKAAVAARDKARAALHRGTYVAPQDETVEAYLKRWIKVHGPELKDSTRRSYEGNIERYLTPALGRERVQSLSPTRLSEFFRTLAESGGKGGRPLSPRTVEFARAVLRRAMNDAVIDRLIEVNPVQGTRHPRVVKPKHTTWTAKQMRAFLTACEGDRSEPLWRLALAIGARRGELAGLRWSDIDLDAGIVHIERSIDEGEGERREIPTKTFERRDVAIDPTTLASLRAWRKAQAAERLAWGPAYRDSAGVVFTWEDGRPLTLDWMTKAFVRAQGGLELPRMTLHGTRHTHATLLLREGVPVHIVAKRLGHRDPSVTLNVYADAIPDDDDRAVETFARALYGA